MTLLRQYGTDHLTSVNPDADAAAMRTFAGQAHFAEARSPRVCNDCQWFKPVIKNDQRGRCGKAANLLMKSIYALPAFPAHARACRFWVAYEEEEEAKE